MAKVTYETLQGFASDVETSGAIPKLLTVSNPKTAKGEGFGYLTAILHLSPARIAGFEVCASRTLGCTNACLNTAGRGGIFEAIHVCRIRRTVAFRVNREAFMRQLEKEISAHVRRAAKHGLTPCIRLNGTSDIPFENVRYVRADGSKGTIFERFPDVQFYDYTKHSHRFARPLPANYDLTFSLADGNEDKADEAMRNGARVAVVFRNAVKPNARKWTLPATWNGVTVVDADATDLRFLDPKGVYCGLRAKGAAKLDKTGFVHDTNPA